MESSVVFAPSELVKNIPLGGVFALIELDEEYQPHFFKVLSKSFDGVEAEIWEKSVGWSGEKTIMPLDFGVIKPGGYAVVGLTQAEFRSGWVERDFNKLLNDFGHWTKSLLLDKAVSLYDYKNVESMSYAAAIDAAGYTIVPLNESLGDLFLYDLIENYTGNNKFVPVDYIKKNSKVLPDLVDEDVKKRIKHLRSKDMLNIFDMEHKVSGELQIDLNY